MGVQEDLPPLSDLFLKNKARYLTYILRLSSDRFYIGTTASLLHRISQHMNGRGAWATTGIAVETVVEIVVCDTKADALRTEWAKVFEYAKRVGWKNVRGAGHVARFADSAIRPAPPQLSLSARDLLRIALQTTPRPLSQEELILVLRGTSVSNWRKLGLRGIPVVRMGRHVQPNQWKAELASAQRDGVVRKDARATFAWCGPPGEPFQGVPLVESKNRQRLLVGAKSLLEKSHPLLSRPKPATNYPNAHAAWSKTELDQLLAMWEDGALIEEIGKRFGRSERAIEAQLARLLPPVDELMDDQPEATGSD